MKLDKGAQLSELELTDEEIRQVEVFSEKISLSQASYILRYGAGVQKKIADFTEIALKNIKSENFEESDQIIYGLIEEVKTFNSSNQRKGFRGLFSREKQNSQNMKSIYKRVNQQIDEMFRDLEKQQIYLLKDIAVLDKIYWLNRDCYKELSMYIMAGQMKIKKTKDNEKDALFEQFEKKIQDMELTRMVSMQLAPQILMMKKNAKLMVNRIQKIMKETIPLWRQQMALALGLNQSKQIIRNAKSERTINNQSMLINKNNVVLADTLEELMKIGSSRRKGSEEVVENLNKIDVDSCWGYGSV